MGRIPGYTAKHNELMLGHYVWQHDDTGDFFVVRKWVPDDKMPHATDAQYGFAHVDKEDGENIHTNSDFNYGDVTHHPIQWPVSASKSTARRLAVAVLKDNPNSLPTDPTAFPWNHHIGLHIGGRIELTEPPEVYA